MNIRNMLSTLLVACSLLCDSCSPDSVFEKENEPMLPNNTYPVNGNNESNPTEGYFTVNTTVADVISDPAFGNFGHLLFPVDRNVPTSMTLSQVSSSSVYVMVFIHIC